MYNANQLLKGAWSAYSGVKAVGELMEDCDVEMVELKTALSKFKSLLDDSFDAWDEFLDKVGADSFMDSLGDLACPWAPPRAPPTP